jgi:hypothetical protein
MYFSLLFSLLTFISVFLTISDATTPVVEKNVSRDELNAIQKMAETVAQLQKELNALSTSCDKKLESITTRLRQDILASQQNLEKCYEQKKSLDIGFMAAQEQLKEMELFKSSLTECQEKATLAKQTDQDIRTKMQQQLNALQDINQQLQKKYYKEFSLHRDNLEKCYSESKKEKQAVEVANQRLTLNSFLLDTCKPYLELREQFYILFNKFQIVLHMVSTKLTQWKNISLTYIIPKLSSASSPLIKQWSFAQHAAKEVVVKLMEKNQTKKYLDYAEKGRYFLNTTMDLIQTHYQTMLNSKTFIEIKKETHEISTHASQKIQQLTLIMYTKIYEYIDKQFPFFNTILINASWNNFYLYLFALMILLTMISWTLFTLKLFFHIISFLFVCLFRCFLKKCSNGVGKRNKKKKKDSVKQKDSHDLNPQESQKNKSFSEMSIFNPPQPKSKKMTSQRSFKR